MLARHHDDDDGDDDDEGSGDLTASSAEFTHATRVVKRLLPDQAGALKLARRYGRALVCVRYRHDTTGRHRYTTVELIVDDAPITPRGHPTDTVAVRIDPDQPTLRSRAYARGAKWDAASGLWLMPRCLAKELRLTRRIVKVLP
ncbi:MAG TPA: hypothetical protein VIO33_08150 [Burkholderiaceae bacterium]